MSSAPDKRDNLDLVAFCQQVVVVAALGDNRAIHFNGTGVLTQALAFQHLTHGAFLVHSDSFTVDRHVHVQE